jgi:hypothetical protein
VRFKRYGAIGNGMVQKPDGAIKNHGLDGEA